eukprot:m.180875 g.180875  ORF g.180875 m.180875 type:complete len:61 (-) comp18434_c0_seq14:230-412(-)
MRLQNDGGRVQKKKFPGFTHKVYHLHAQKSRNALFDIHVTYLHPAHLFFDSFPQSEHRFF